MFFRERREPRQVGTEQGLGKSDDVEDGEAHGMDVACRMVFALWRPWRQARAAARTAGFSGKGGVFTFVSQHHMNTLNRRHFLRSSAAAGLGLSALGMPRARAASPNGKLRVLSIGVVGTIGKADRRAVASHPNAEIVGLCDVDSNYLAEAAKDHPNAFTCRDYREAFAKHADKFDAVIVSVPDHSHAPILLTAMAHDKHVYGQKPLVHQLAELVMVERALKAKPHLVTQLGNQRMAHPGRRAAVEILRQGQLGKAIEAFAWTGSPNPGGPYFNYEKVLKENSKAARPTSIGTCGSAPAPRCPITTDSPR